jgi:hypothetical protein
MNEIQILYSFNFISHSNYDYDNLYDPRRSINNYRVFYLLALFLCNLFLGNKRGYKRHGKGKEQKIMNFGL